MTTYPVLVECVHLMYKRIGVAKTLAWMEVLNAQGVGVFVMGANHLPRATALMRQYGDLPMDLADASLVIRAEEFGEGTSAIFMPIAGKTSIRSAICW